MTKSMGDMVAISKDGRVAAIFKKKKTWRPQKGKRKVWCYMCGKWKAPSKDHFWPKSLGGTQMFPASSNVWYMCGWCNSAKGNTMPTWAHTMAFSIAKGFCKL